MGLDNLTQDDKQLFLVKVRIDSSKIIELGQKLQSGELSKKKIQFTYCLKDDPTVGLSLWAVKNKEDFDEFFKPHKEYYKEIMEVLPAIKPNEAMNLIMQEMKL